MSIQTRHKLWWIVVLLASASPPAAAQSTVSPSSDWNGNFSFSSTADRNLRLLRSDLIKKEESGYYESLGKTQITSTNHIQYGDRIETQTNSETNEIGQQTTAIGAVNTSTNNIDISGRGNISVATDNQAVSSGCQDGRVSIDSQPFNTSPTCN